MPELTVAEVLTLLSALGIGGAIVKLIEKFFDRNRIGAETDEIIGRTNKTISEIVEQSTEKLKDDFKEALLEIEMLKMEVRQLHLSLDRDKQFERIRGLEGDVEFWKKRSSILSSQNRVLLEQLEGRLSNGDE